MNGFEKRANLIKDKIMRTTWNWCAPRSRSEFGLPTYPKATKVSQVTIYNYFGEGGGWRARFSQLF